jgi:superoxide dismutase, Fe-Mn family
MSASLKSLSTSSQTDAPREMVPAMALALSASFGSVAQWRDDVVALCHAAPKDAAWLLLSLDASQGRLRHQWAEVEGSRAILACALGQDLDVQGFLTHIAWDAVYERYQHAVHAASQAWAADPAQLAHAELLDVRRAGVFEKAPTLLPGARWRDPALVAHWQAELPRDRPVVVYCVYGHEVGRSTALRLRAAGVDARFLPGGIDAWTLAGRPLVSKEPMA